MFAGALREEVFSGAPVIRRITDEFVPVAISVPRYFGEDAESRFYRALTFQKLPPTSAAPVPQGLCVLAPDGTVMEWVQVFRDAGAVMQFLDRTQAAFRAHTGAAPLAAAHPAGERCPGTPVIQRGSLHGTLYGQARDANGALLGTTGAQSLYMQEALTLARHDADELAALARSAGRGTRVPVPEPLVRRLLSEWFLGQKDASLLANPVGAMARIYRLELSVEGPLEDGRARLIGAFDVVTQRERLLRHEQRLDLEGVVAVDAAGLARLTLVGRGTYHFQWNGFSDEADRFRQLMAGRAVDAAHGVTFGLVAVRRDTGVEQPEAGPSPEVAIEAMLNQIGGHRDEARLRAEFEALRPELRALHEGTVRDPARAHAVSRRVHALAKELEPMMTPR